MIFLTPEFLKTKNNSIHGDYGRIFVHEWAKFRWGVFEEYGHEDDPVYPAFEQESNHSFKPTGCSNTKVHGIPESCPNQKKCNFVPSLSQNDAVTSSLMYMHYLPRVTQFCDETTHNSRAPTKQNLQCNGQSVWSVMLRHSDFSNSSSPMLEISRDVTPIFHYVKPTPKRYVIVIEDTTVMNIQKRWEFFRKAIRKLLVYDIPPGHEVGVVLFDQISYVKLPLTPIPSTLGRRQRLATASLPRNPSQIAPSQKCLHCGLEEAIQMLQQDSGSSAGGVIFLISSGTPIPTSHYNLEQLEQMIRESEVKLVPILYPVINRNPLPSPGVEKLAEISETHSFAVLDEGIGSDSKVSMMVSLMNALYAALRQFISAPSQLPILVHQREFPGGVAITSQGNFDIDQSLGGKVKFCLTYYDLGHVGNTINLIDPNGDLVDSYNLQEEDGDVNMIFVTIRNAMPGRWSYRIENRADSHQSLFIQVYSTPAEEPVSRRSGVSTHHDKRVDAINLEAWTSTSKSVLDASDHSKHPLLIYAKLWSGMKPVIGAKVQAVVQRLGLNNSGVPFQAIRFDLFDNGNGDSDLTKYDGVYSRYFPLLEDIPARFTVSVEATDNNQKSVIIFQSIREPPEWISRSNVYKKRRKRALGYASADPTCCGSQIPHSRTISTGMLSRAISIGILDVVGQKTSVGLMSPSRVGDFSVQVDNAALHARFSWSAPGDQKDFGRATKYEVVFSRDFAQIKSGSGESIDQWPSPEKANTPSQHTIRWNRHDGVYYVVLRAVGRSGNKGPWSNVVTVYVPPPATTTEINTKDSTVSGTSKSEAIGELSPPAKNRAFLANKYLLAIIGGSCGLLFLVLIIAIYYMVIITRRKDKKDPKSKEVMVESSLGPDSHESETDSIDKKPADAVVLSEISGSVQRPLSPIQSWPASRLLAEHERRRSMDPNYGDIPPEIEMYPPPPPFYYHSPNGGHYIEDTIPIDGGSLLSTLPSESLGHYKLDSSLADSQISNQKMTGFSTPNSIGGNVVAPPQNSLGSGQGQLQMIRRPPKVPPPTLPKPILGSPMDMSAPERRRRNVTQV